MDPSVCSACFYLSVCVCMYVNVHTYTFACVCVSGCVCHCRDDYNSLDYLGMPDYSYIISLIQRIGCPIKYMIMSDQVHGYVQSFLQIHHL